MSTPPAAGTVSAMPALAVVAGAGRLPAEIAAEAAERGEAVVILPLKGFADADFAGYAQYPVSLIDPKGVLQELARAGAGRVILAGAVHRPGLGMVRSGIQAVRHLEEIRNVLEGGDDNLLRGVIVFLEKHGYAVVGVRDVAPSLMAPRGTLGHLSPSAAELEGIAIGQRALAAMGPSDIGQGVVVAQRRVLAVEAAEGTDNMIRRVAVLRRLGLFGRLSRHGRPPIAEQDGGVLVKAAKPGQDFRADLPSIGPRTVRLAKKAGLAGIAIEAGNVLVLERDATIAAADAANLFLVGV
ncbi:LpxI family protein [Labrys sp. La1]|uniref:LpxI family protein n=1 Tax=Labrys sp. La1 TaxID=3404917 RepID=UPI003EB7E241